MGLTRAYNKGICEFSFYPPVINIEVSSRCNLGCLMCARIGTLTRKTGDMSFDVYKKIVDQTHRLAELYVLHNDGEPLLNKELPEMVAYAHKKGVAVMLSTNATLLSEEIGARLIQGGLDLIMFTVDGASKETYEKIRVGATFEEVIGNIEHFIDCKKSLDKSNPYIIIQFIEMSENKHEIPDFKKFWSRYPVQCFIKPSIQWHRKLNISHRSACDRLWYQSIILDKGDVIPCCADLNASYSLGNINSKDFIQLWNGVKMCGIRHANTGGANGFSLCTQCNYIPPRSNTFVSNIAQCMLDFGTLAKVLYIIGFKRKRQI